MWLIVGLGNPGDKYRFHRHNVGFLLIDWMREALSSTAEKVERKALTSTINLSQTNLLLAKPQTFMNLSGESVLSLSQFYKIPPDRMLVAHDDVDLEFGQLKLQKARGHGGQNGVRDIHLKLGTNDYPRLRIGVGRPKIAQMSVADYVLQNFDSLELSELNMIFKKATLSIETLVTSGFERAATLANTKEN